MSGFCFLLYSILHNLLVMKLFAGNDEDKSVMGLLDESKGNAFCFWWSLVFDYSLVVVAYLRTFEKL